MEMERFVVFLVNVIEPRRDKFDFDQTTWIGWTSAKVNTATSYPHENNIL